MKRIFILFLIGLCCSSFGFSAPNPVVWYTHQANEPIKLNVDLFISSTCPYCKKADAFFVDTEKKYPWIVVHRYVINEDKSALQRFYERVQGQNMSNFSVPSVFFCGSRWSGFQDATSSGQALLKGLKFCRDKISEQGKLSATTISTLKQWGTASQVELGKKVTTSIPWAMAMSALLEAFNPCSMFCFAAFLAFLWLFPKQRGLQLRVGGIFLLTLAATHFVQQVYSECYEAFIPKFRVPALLIGVLMLLFLFNRYLKRQSGAPIKLGLLVISLLVFTVIGIQVYQQTCPFNFGLVFSQWLSAQSLSKGSVLFYQLGYQFFYVLPLLIWLIIHVLVCEHPKMMGRQPLLAVVGYLILASIAVLLIACPFCLANSIFSIVILFASFVVGWGLSKGGVRILDSD